MFALQRQLRPFAREDTRRSYRAVVPTMLLAVALQAALLNPLPPLALWPASLLFGLVLLRMFAFYHDVQHGALFRRTRWARLIVNLFCVYFTYPPGVWRDRHNDHHRRNSQVNTRDVAGEFPMLSVAQFRRLNRRDRLLYRIYRHPLAIALGYVPYFLLPVWSAFRADPRRYWAGPLVIAVQWGLVFLIASTLGWQAATAAFVLPVLFAASVGSYLFYAQHCFRGVRYQMPEQWDYYRAAAESTSFFRMPGWMHWFTGNIGYHHIHHFNALIPCYRLPEAMAALPSLQAQPSTDWRLGSLAHNMSRHLWDEETGSLLSYREAARRETPAERWGQC